MYIECSGRNVCYDIPTNSLKKNYLIGSVKNESKKLQPWKVRNYKWWYLTNERRSLFFLTSNKINLNPTKMVLNIQICTSTKLQYNEARTFSLRFFSLSLIPHKRNNEYHPPFFSLVRVALEYLTFRVTGFQNVWPRNLSFTEIVIDIARFY